MSDPSLILNIGDLKVELQTCEKPKRTNVLVSFVHQPSDKSPAEEKTWQIPVSADVDKTTRMINTIFNDLASGEFPRLDPKKQYEFFLNEIKYEGSQNKVRVGKASDVSKTRLPGGGQ